MRFTNCVLLLLLCFFLQGCDLDQLADSLVFDSANLALDNDNWTDKQRDMYYAIAKLDNAECVDVVTRAGIRFIQDPITRASVKPSADPYAAVFSLMDPSLPTASREDQFFRAKHVALSICYTLSRYLARDNELIDVAARQAAIESANDELKSPLSEYQRQKYRVLIELGRENCVAEIAKVYVQMVTDSNLQSNLNSHGKSTMTIAALNYDPVARAGIAQSAAGLVCDQLSLAFLHPNEGSLI